MNMLGKKYSNHLIFMNHMRGLKNLFDFPYLRGE